MKHHLYLCGPISNMPDFNRPAFNQAAQALRESGYDVFNPVENGIPPDAQWTEHMRADIKALMDCRALAVLPGTAHSKGANLEIHNAKELGMPIASVNAWLLMKEETGATT